MVPANDALQRLREGNRRFVSNIRGSDAFVSHTGRVELTAGQQPFAIILGCSDSRVPAEIVFDQGLGDLFVIRVAGNIVAPSQVGSVEFAAARYDTRLVVVLVRPSIEGLLATDLRHDMEALVTQGVRANIRASVDHLRHGSEVLEQL